MVPVTELRGAIPIGIAMGLNPIWVYVFSVIGSTLVSIPLILTLRHVLQFLRGKKLFKGIADVIDRKINSRMKKLKSVSIIGIILFVGIPLPTTGTWTASAIASILKMRIKDAFMGVFLGNLLSGVIVSALSLHII
ncbi:small multi-drug export family protein [Clostridioides difficile P7]|nr:small multi-drug export family protein [Clostridioides difficile P7]